MFQIVCLFGVIVLTAFVVILLILFLNPGIPKDNKKRIPILAVCGVLFDILSFIGLINTPPLEPTITVSYISDDVVTIELYTPTSVFTDIYYTINGERPTKQCLKYDDIVTTKIDDLIEIRAVTIGLFSESTVESKEIENKEVENQIEDSKVDDLSTLKSSASTETESTDAPMANLPKPTQKPKKTQKDIMDSDLVEDSTEIENNFDEFNKTELASTPTSNKESAYDQVEPTIIVVQEGDNITYNDTSDIPVLDLTGNQYEFSSVDPRMYLNYSFDATIVEQPDFALNRKELKGNWIFSGMNNEANTISETVQVYSASDSSKNWVGEASYGVYYFFNEYEKTHVLIDGNLYHYENDVQVFEPKTSYGTFYIDLSDEYFVPGNYICEVTVSIDEHTFGASINFTVQ